MCNITQYLTAFKILALSINFVTPVSFFANVAHHGKIEQTQPISVSLDSKFHLYQTILLFWI